MNLVSVEGVSKAYPELPILDDVTLGIHDGDRIGVIGANGSGKSTLLGIIAGTVDIDSGRVIRRSGTRIALLAQEPDMDSQTTLAEIAEQSHPTLVLLDRMGFKDLNQRIADLSGGQRRRVALAQCLATEADITILDEPTNHLDVEVIDWLEDEIATRPGALVMVTHDRYVLDRVCTSIVEVHGQQLMSHKGTYQDFLVARAEREALAEATEQKRQNRARTELAWLERSPKARTGKQKARIKSATALVDQESGVIARPVLEFDLPTRRIGSKVVNLDSVGVTFGDNAVLAGITWHLAEDARVGIVGPNGAGKTTLLRLVAGQLEPSVGKVSMGDTIVPGWYGQDPEPIPGNRRILETIREVSEQTRLDSGLSISASQLLERFGFPSRQHSTLVDELSGGERRRLELLRVLAEAPNLLLLDEPTNDLDLDTLGALEAYLDNWPGALVAATHDRYFLERVCTDVVSVQADGSIFHHPGGWAAYRDAEIAGKAPKATKAGKPRPSGTDYGVRLSSNEQHERREIEQELPKLERQIASVKHDMDGVGTDWERAAKLVSQLKDAQARLAKIEDRWLELSERDK
ncbi:MAG: ABC-F family ATP-binding cassette domain-containing protein [Acidimicrobiia bacterium]|nr:ABC-F family ATP-binding cassette domain-containing protein [Acidimicrobiia bacterium]MDH5505319.1 ABC-F family ATP-binding cassette domain-containing protein [Acidimicrobiia bacterium]